MSVLIKGIEIPKESERPYWVVIHSDGTVEYNENKDQGWQTSKVVTVQSHGRLIDADKMRESIMKQTALTRLIGGEELAEIAETCRRNMLSAYSLSQQVISRRFW